MHSTMASHLDDLPSSAIISLTDCHRSPRFPEQAGYDEPALSSALVQQYLLKSVGVDILNSLSLG